MAAARAVRLEARYRALADRLRQEPGVLDVTYDDQMPQLTQGRHFIKMDPGPAAEHSERCMEGYSCVGFVSVDPRFFDVVGAPVIRGRALTTADAEHGTRVMLVNETFVEEVLGSRNPIGRRFRFASSEPTAESWYEIVGVVPDLSVSDKGTSYDRTRIYRATLPREAGPLRVAIHVRGECRRLTPQLTCGRVKYSECEAFANPRIARQVQRPLGCRRGDPTEPATGQAAGTPSAPMVPKRRIPPSHE